MSQLLDLLRQWESLQRNECFVTTQPQEEMEDFLPGALAHTIEIAYREPLFMIENSTFDPTAFAGHLGPLPQRLVGDPPAGTKVYVQFQLISDAEENIQLLNYGEHLNDHVRSEYYAWVIQAALQHNMSHLHWTWQLSCKGTRHQAVIVSPSGRSEVGKANTPEEALLLAYLRQFSSVN